MLEVRRKWHLVFLILICSFSLCWQNWTVLVLTKSWSRYQVMQRAYWLNWKRLTWSRKTYMYFVADYEVMTSVIYIGRFSNFCRYFSFSWDDYKFTSCLLFSVFSAMIWALKMPAWFFDRRSRKNGANFAIWLLDFDWLPISHECLILPANCITIPDKVIIKKCHVSNFNMPMSSSQTK